MRDVVGAAERDGERVGESQAGGVRGELRDAAGGQHAAPGDEVVRIGDDVRRCAPMSPTACSAMPSDTGLFQTLP